ncbi:MAG: beta-lactamase family protein [Clostridiales bacterium]|jgi:CubicO group peptidase (beta-lactamase class C family)|nr:beta-lactamase family protein [Clostridiales bacterium]
MEKSKIRLARAARPEDVGVSPKALLETVCDFEREKTEIHSFLVLRHGKVAFEYYRAPFDRDTPRSVYSFSKSICSTAAAYAIDEGLISLDSGIYDFFPEYKITKKSALRYKDEVTVRALLTMTTGKSINVARDKAKIDWIGDFLNSPTTHRPGEHFHYTNENAFMISAIIHKLTGASLSDYLQPRLFDPLGIERPVWETDKNGVTGGGFGLYLTPEDGAKIMQCYLDGGKFEGKRVIPGRWTEQATIKQVSNEKNRKPDSRVGYGYQFWMCTPPNTFAGRGMFGQHGIVMRDADACFFYTGCEVDEQKPMEILFRRFPAGFSDGMERDNGAYAELISRTSGLKADDIPVSPPNPLEKQLNGKLQRWPKQRFLSAVGMPTSVLPLSVTYTSVDKHGSIDNASLAFADGEAVFSWYEGAVFNQIPLGLDGKYRYGKIKLPPFDLTTAGYAYWETPNALCVHIRFIESVGKRIFRFEFKDRRIRITQASTPEGDKIIGNITVLAESFINNDFIYFFVKRLSGLIPRILEPEMRAKIKK